MRIPKRNTTLLCTAIGITAVAGFLISCATIDHVVVAPPMIPGAKYVGDESCAACHEKVAKDFKLAQHARIPLRALKEHAEKGVDQIGCEACHGPGSLHVEAGGGKGNILNSGKSPEGCFQCHQNIQAQLKLPYHHPVIEGRVSCVDCHNVHGPDTHTAKKLGMGRENDSCARCHREQSMPRVYEHEALREGCTACHNVHGSVNPKMLVERDNNLCQKCHGQAHNAQDAVSSRNIYIGKAQHNNRLNAGTCWSAGCHHGVHGSNVDSHFRY